MQIGILGPGGVGGLLGALLARQGAEVVSIASPSTASVIAQRGISVSSTRFGNVHAQVRAETELRSAVDVLCVAVKATTLSESLGRVPPDVLGDATVIPFLNGFEHVEVLRAKFPVADVVAATIRIESTRIAPGEIVQASPFATIELAPQRRDGGRTGEFAALLRKAGFDVNVRDHEAAILWEKLSFLAPLALMTTAHDARAGEVRTAHRGELTAVIREVARVAAAVGVPVDPDKVLHQFDSVPETMQSSMQRDAQSGNPLEVDAIGGAIVRTAARAGIPVPTVTRLVERLETRSS